MKTEIRPKIGVLALQGAFHLHQWHVEASGAEYLAVAGKGQLGGVDGLILPGGESGVMLKLIEAMGMWDELERFFSSKPAWGICAGAILMAKTVRNPDQRSFGVIDIEVQRNAYGRQLESTDAIVDDYRIAYIRAPRIVRIGDGVTSMGRRERDPIWVESKMMMVTTFHPETNRERPSPWHRRFMDRCSSHDRRV